MRLVPPGEHEQVKQLIGGATQAYIFEAVPERTLYTNWMIVGIDALVAHSASTRNLHGFVCVGRSHAVLPRITNSEPHAAALAR